jgi:hypothetical protein
LLSDIHARASDFHPFVHQEDIMIRRELFGALSVTAAGLMGAIGRVAQAGDQDHHDEVHEGCLKNCQACKRECDEAFHFCASELAGGKKEYAGALHLVADCAAFCDLSATLIARQSQLMVHACAACAKACQDCGAECDKFTDAALKECAKACHDCEASCRTMIKSSGDHHC